MSHFGAIFDARRGGTSMFGIADPAQADRSARWGSRTIAFEFDQLLAVDGGSAARGAAQRRSRRWRCCASAKLIDARRARAIDPRPQRLGRRADGRGRPSGRGRRRGRDRTVVAEDPVDRGVDPRRHRRLQVRPERRPWRAARRAQAAPRLPPAPAAAGGRLQGRRQARQDLLHGRRPRHFARRA